jgi:hypothetical protein
MKAFESYESNFVMIIFHDFLFFAAGWSW